ncbi:MAG: YceI family protein [Candidatus Obscuribacterales bacterium]|nr:YceI family protein [Candidatus Obscuribacterales bacterium]
MIKQFFAAVEANDFARITFAGLATSLLIQLGSPSRSAAALEGWALDQQHCKAIFSVKHYGLAPVTGWFNKVYGSARYDAKDLKKSYVKAFIETTSINSGSGPRDFHLRSEHFLDTKAYPMITFDSTELKPQSKGKFQLVGTLTIKDKKKKVVLDCEGPVGPITDEKKQKRLGFTAKTTINRKDFGITWNREASPGLFMVGDQIDILLEIELMQ